MTVVNSSLEDRVIAIPDFEIIRGTKLLFAIFKEHHNPSSEKKCTGSLVILQRRFLNPQAPVAQKSADGMVFRHF